MLPKVKSPFAAAGTVALHSRYVHGLGRRLLSPIQEHAPSLTRMRSSTATFLERKPDCVLCSPMHEQRLRAKRKRSATTAWLQNSFTHIEDLTAADIEEGRREKLLVYFLYPKPSQALTAEIMNHLGERMNAWDLEFELTDNYSEASIRITTDGPVSIEWLKAPP